MLTRGVYRRPPHVTALPSQRLAMGTLTLPLVAASLIFAPAVFRGAPSAFFRPAARPFIATARVSSLVFPAPFSPGFSALLTASARYGG